MFNICRAKKIFRILEQAQLDPSFFNQDNSLKDSVREILIDVSHDIITSLEDKGVTLIPEFIILTGSLCGANWDEYSDVDFHIGVDYSRFTDEKLAEDFLAYFAKEFNNKKYDILGRSLELYFQNHTEPHETPGIYDIINNHWIKLPEETIVKVDQEVIKAAEQYKKEIENKVVEYNTIPRDRKKIHEFLEKLNTYFELIRKMRKTSLLNGGMYSFGNLVFKQLRRNGSLQILTDLIRQVQDDYYDVWECLSEDFKTVELKFIEQGFSREEIKNYLDKFKKNKVKIKDKTDLNIDTWGKKDFTDFKSFVDSLEKTTTKTQAKKLAKQDGAELVFEDKDWYVYQITTKEASINYGSGTKWCISAKNDNHYDSYAEKVNFYFYISKTLDSSNPNYKIAMIVYFNEMIEYYDAIDDKFDEPPIKLPRIKFEIPEQKIEIEGKFYTFKQLENMELEVKGNLDLSKRGLTKLPKIKSVGGWFDCSNNNLTTLQGSPTKVGGDFYCFNNNLTTLDYLPIYIGGFLMFDEEDKLSIPEGVTIGSLDLNNREIEELPNNLTILDNLYLKETNLTKLPNNLTVGGAIYLQGSQITELPPDLKAKQVTVTKSKFKSTFKPEGVKEIIFV